MDLPKTLFITIFQFKDGELGGADPQTDLGEAYDRAIDARDNLDCEFDLFELDLDVQNRSVESIKNITPDLIWRLPQLYPSGSVA